MYLVAHPCALMRSLYIISVHVLVILKEPLILVVMVKVCVNVEREQEVINAMTACTDIIKWRLAASVSWQDTSCAKHIAIFASLHLSCKWINQYALQCHNRRLRLC